ncbi:ras-associating and dilute domain-containing protein-like isoform X2 [Asterias amurensis]|uniref:ras-associating and dilute domain-containing protein-like isoform X2 n=1 Tax=Asterias amurensis TaxID=7602 RepID=UPI003AB72B1C
MMDPEVIERLRASSGSGSSRGSSGGLFQQKRTGIGLLADPLIIAHLKHLHQDAQNKAKMQWEDESGLGDGGAEETVARERLAKKITAYNQGRHRGAFTVTQTEGLKFAGALRFYFEDGGNKLAKAIWLTSQTTVEELMPRFREKFNLLENGRWRTNIYQVHNLDEIRLASEERPLDIAIHSERNVRFILRMEPNPKSLAVPDADAPSQRKSLSRFFGVSNSDLAAPYSAAVSTASPVVKSKSHYNKNGKKQSSADTVSLSSNSSSSSLSLLSPPTKVPMRHHSAGNVNVNGDTSGLLLKTKTPNFIRKFQAGENAFRKLTKKDNGYGQKTSTKNLRKRSRARSLSSMFERGITLTKKEPCDNSKQTKELSTEETAPGLLKVFGDQICPNATYKSVLASGQSSAVELVKVVLERYSLPVDTYGEYVLCDVIGTLKINPEKASRVLGITDECEEKQEWITECMRVMGNDERPLTVKSFWKPEEGFARKFEIRRRADIASGDVDTITHGINVNAKRLQLSRANRTPGSPCNSPRNKENDPKIVLSSSETDINSKKLNRRLSLGQSENEETESSNEPIPTNYLLPPRYCPYLLTLHGNSLATDQTLYPIDDVACLVGRLILGNSGTDIGLDSPDINPEHCRILLQCDYMSTSINRNCSLYIEPIGDSKVLVNGCTVTRSTKLSANDLIAIGQHYFFLLKNPLMMQTREPSQMIRLLTAANQSEPLSDPNSDANNALPKHTSSHIAKKAREYFADSQRLRVSYPMVMEDAVLDGIAGIVPALVEGKHNFTLTLSYLVGMCIEHSAYNYDQERTKALMLKVATIIQSLAWDKTKEIAANQKQKPSDVQSVMDSLFPDLKTILCLLANALEVLNFLKTKMGDYIQGDGEGDQQERETRDGEEEAGGSGVEEEAVVELEEVVMYTFQQAVYYLTKTLFIAIPMFLDSNPFSDDEVDEEEGKTKGMTKGMDSVLSVFQMTFDLLLDLDIHPQITSQLFAYLLFFTNASLFNMLIERGSNGKFYKWSKGAQMRGNLDVLETWLNDHDLEDLTKYLTRVSMVIDLLATPKVQLMQADWSSLQRDFPSLNTLQIHHILSKYQLGPNQTRPTGWLPAQEVLQAAAGTERTLERFDNHPALALPNQGFELDLRQPINNEYFIGHLQELSRQLPYITFNMGCEEDVFDMEVKSSAAKSNTEKILSSPRRNPAKPSNNPQLDAESVAVDVLKRPLEVEQVVPIAVANTVRVPPTELGVKSSDEDKMSPRVFPDKPPISAKPSIPSKPPSIKSRSKIKKDLPSPTSQSKTDSSLVNRADRVDAGNVAIATIPSITMTVDDDAPVEEPSKENTNQREVKSAVSSNPVGHESSPEFEEPKKPCPTLSSSTSLTSSSPLITTETEESSSLPNKKDLDDVFVVDLDKGQDGVGLGLIDGMHTSLRSQGIYVRKLVPDSTAMQDGRMKIGDRILAVNGTSLVGADYNRAMHLIRSSGVKLRFLVAKSEPSVALKISASVC